MTDEERWERLQEVLRYKERADALRAVLQHYVDMLAEATREAA